MLTPVTECGEIRAYLLRARRPRAQPSADSPNPTFDHGVVRQLKWAIEHNMTVGWRGPGRAGHQGGLVGELQLFLGPVVV